MRGFNYKKSVQALNLFATLSGGTLNKMKALKLIWLSDRLHLRKYGRTITGDVYFALPFGPVASTTRDLLELSNLSKIEEDYFNRYLIQNSDKYVYSSIVEPYLRVFSDTDLSVLNEIYTKYNHLDKYELSDLSHQFPEWSKYQADLKRGTCSRFRISFNDFFINVNDKTGLFMDSKEYLLLSKEIFDENKMYFT